MNKPLRRIISATLALSVSVTLAVNAYAEATANSSNQDVANVGYARKGQYVLFSTGENAMQLNTTKTTVNGNLYVGGDLNAYSGEIDVNGKTVLGGKLYKHDYTVWDSYIFEENADKQSLDNKTLDNAFTSLLGEDYLTHEYWYTYSGSEVTGDASIYAKSGLQYCADSVNISGTLISDSYMMISASKAFTTEGEINMYVKNGNVGIYAGEVDIDGVLYAPNGTVQICATDVDISGMIIAKDIQISAQNVTISENLTLSAAQYVKCYEDQIFAINAEYNAESKNIDVALASTYPGGNYSIYTSYDGEEYLLNGTTTETSYSFAADETADVIYIKAVQIYDNGVSLNSNIVKMVADEEKGFVQEYVDTDSDGLIDMYEHIFSSDIENPDTDGDGLSDFVEVMMSATDPLYIDSDEDGIADGNEDCDEDKLTNLQEIAYNTSIVSKDTDSDGLADYDEIFVYGTKPENPDTDGDTINDGDEVSLGLDPLNADSDGNGTDDCKEKIKQTYVHDVENEDCAVDEVIVDIEATGNIQATMSVESVMGVDVLCSNVAGLVGEPFEINTTSEFDEATITFKVDAEKLDTEIDNLLFLWYDEENGIYKELETVVDAENMTISTTTTHFSKYMVVDKRQWFKAWAKEFDYNPTVGVPGAPTIPVKYNTVLAIDCSGSMDWNDPISVKSGINSPYDALYPYTCNRITAAEGFIDYMESSDETAIVFFTGVADVVAPPTSDKSTLKLALQKTYSSGGTSFGVALDESITQIDSANKTASGVNKNRIILLTDGDDGGSKSRRNAAIEECKEKGIEIYTVGFGSANDALLQHIADETGGKYYKALSSSDIIDIFARLGYEEDFDMTDTDGDGLPDAVETAGIRTQNGTVIYGCDPTNPDTDGDGLLDGEEINPTPLYSKKEDKSWLGIKNLLGINTVQGYYFKMYSNPRYADTDGEGLLDINDPAPMTERNYGSRYITMNDEQYVKILQQCLEYLGYLDMDGNPYGTFGGLTSVATQLYQINHRIYLKNVSLKINEYVDASSESGTGIKIMLDEVTFYSIIREALNCGFEAPNDTLWGTISVTNSYTFFKNKFIPKSVPLEEINVSLNPDNPVYIKSVESKLSSEKHNIYIYDLTVPLEGMLRRGAQEFHFHHYMCDAVYSWVEGVGSNYLTYTNSSKQCRKYRSDIIWLILNVANNMRYDVKTENSWKAFFCDLNLNVPYYHSSMPFVFKGEEMNAEIFGNILYGYAGNAGGYGRQELSFAGSLYSRVTTGKWDNEEDSTYVKRGFDMYDDIKRDYTYLHITKL